MSFDFYPNEQDAALRNAARNPSLTPEPGIWANFASGAAKTTMQGFAQVGRSVDLLGAVGPIVEDRLTGGTTAQDKYFQEHDDVFNRAVDYWTPRPGEVGTAGRTVGGLISGLATVALSPSLAVGSQIFNTGESLVRAGVAADKALAAGMIQGTGLGLGIYLPILGNSLLTRALAGAGSNVAQGVLTNAATGYILKGTESAKDYNAWDAESIALDALMGMGFGALAHAGAGHPELTPEQKAALLVANQARHAEDTTAPGRPVTAVDQTAHADALRQAVDDVLNGRSANVEAMLRGTQFADDPARVEAQREVRDAVASEAKRVLLETMAQEQARITAGEKPGFLRTPEDLISLRGGHRDVLGPDMQRAAEIVRKPGFQRTAEEKIFLDSMLNGKAFDHLTRPIELLTETDHARARAGEIEASALDPEGKKALSGLYEAAAAAKPGFDASISRIAEAVGGRAILPALKGVKRTLQKVAVDYKGDPSRLKDVLRATIEVHSPAAAARAIDAIQRKFKVLEQGQRNLLDPAAQPLDGYRDAKFNVDINGHVAEIQINVPSMLEAKKSVHAQYEERSRIERESAGRQRTAEEESAVARLNAEMRAAYDEAWATSLTSAAKADSETGAPLRRAEPGSNTRGGSSSQAAQEGTRGSSELPRDTGMPSTSKNSVRGENLGNAERTASDMSMANTSTESIPRSSLLAEALARLAQRPELAIHGGQDADGNPIFRPLGEELAAATAEVARAKSEGNLFTTAAQCLLGSL